MHICLYTYVYLYTYMYIHLCIMFENAHPKSHRLYNKYWKPLSKLVVTALQELP